MCSALSDIHCKMFKEKVSGKLPHDNKIPVWHFSPSLPRHTHKQQHQLCACSSSWCIHFWAMFHCCKYPSSSASMNHKSPAFHYVHFFNRESENSSADNADMDDNCWHKQGTTQASLLMRIFNFVCKSTWAERMRLTLKPKTYFLPGSQSRRWHSKLITLWPQKPLETEDSTTKFWSCSSSENKKRF